MTLLGKIFTMLIFIAALVWMSLSVALYMTQKNWKDVVVRPKEQATGADKPLGLQHQKKQLEETIKRLQEELAALHNTLHAERAARASALAGLEEAVQSEIALRRGAEQTAVALNEAHRQAVADVASKEERLKAQTDEIAVARATIKTAEQDRDDKLQKIAALTDLVNQLDDTRRRLQERQKALVDQISRMKLVLDSRDLSEFTNVDGIPPPVQGRITAVNKNFVEISIGSDDGLLVGHQLDVFNGSTYKGRLVVRKTDPDKSVAEVITELQKGEMQKDDRVNTRTKLS
jgi:hypothetical protein